MARAARNRIGIELKDLESWAERLEKAGGKIEKVAEKCLVAAHETVTPAIQKDMKRHRRTGKTEAAILTEADVTWEGTRASVPVGFNIKEGGLPSIFLMYGTPRMKKDAKLYNDIYGSKIKKEIAKRQEEIFRDAMLKL